METADPTCELLSMEKTLIPDFDEGRAFLESRVPNEKAEEGYNWPWTHPKMRELLLSKEVREMGSRWYEHEGVLRCHDLKPTVDRIGGAIDRLLASHGYHHDTEKGVYTVDPEVMEAVRNGKEERVAIFAHEGVAKFLLSHVLDIPFPYYATHFEINHSSMSVIWIRTFTDGTTSARMLSLSNDSHLYRDGLPLDYRHTIRF